MKTKMQHALHFDHTPDFNALTLLTCLLL